MYKLVLTFFLLLLLEIEIIIFMFLPFFIPKQKKEKFYGRKFFRLITTYNMVFLLQRSLSAVPLFYARITKRQKNQKIVQQCIHTHTHTTCLIVFTRASCVTHLICVVAVVFLLKCYKHSSWNNLSAIVGILEYDIGTAIKDVIKINFF